MYVKRLPYFNLPLYTGSQEQEFQALFLIHGGSIPLWNPPAPYWFGANTQTEASTNGVDWLDPNSSPVVPQGMRMPHKICGWHPSIHHPTAFQCECYGHLVPVWHCLYFHLKMVLCFGYHFILDKLHHLSNNYAVYSVLQSSTCKGYSHCWKLTTAQVL